MGSTTGPYAREIVLWLLQQYQVITPKMAMRHGLDRKSLDRLASPDYQILRRAAPGRYVYRDVKEEDVNPLIVWMRKPHAGSFLFGPTAAALHKLVPTPGLVWVGLPANAQRPRTGPDFRFHYFSERKMSEGIVNLDADSLYSTAARSCAELFLVRRQVGELLPQVALANYRAKHPGARAEDDLVRMSVLMRVFTSMMRAIENPIAPELLERVMSGTGDGQYAVAHDTPARPST